MTRIHQNLVTVRHRIGEACARSGRLPSSVRLLVVSKTFGVSDVQTAIDAGECEFGENYVQEGLEKIQALMSHRHRLVWHLIGPLQSNKTKLVAEHFDWVHSIDRLKVAQRLSEQRPDNLPPLQVCLQVNISGEDSKSGVMPEEVPALAKAVAALPRLRLRGLMAIPEPAVDEAAQRVPHRALAALFADLKSQGCELDTLSMGMTADLEAAILEGATLVRVGSAIFGERGIVPR